MELYTSEFLKTASQWLWLVIIFTALAGRYWQCRSDADNSDVYRQPRDRGLVGEPLGFPTVGVHRMRVSSAPVQEDRQEAA